MKKLTQQTNELNFNVLIEQDEDGWYVASVPTIPGCYTQGKTLEQARTRIRQAIRLSLKADPQLKQSLRSLPTPRFFGIENISLPYAQT